MSRVRPKARELNCVPSTSPYVNEKRHSRNHEALRAHCTQRNHRTASTFSTRTGSFPHNNRRRIRRRFSFLINVVGYRPRYTWEEKVLLYVGLDVHKRFCYGTLTNEKGEVVKKLETPGSRCEFSRIKCCVYF